jgi:thymidylate synthase (FAD)
MKIIEPSFEFEAPFNNEIRNIILQRIEKIGRVCYKSEGNITNQSASQFVAKVIRNKHLSVIEHISVSVRFIHNRGFTHELVRHRIASFSQESTRYVKYNGDIQFIKPYWFDMGDNEAEELWYKAMARAEVTYYDMLDLGLPAQASRGILPNDLKTEIVITANLREWIHIFSERCAGGAHPDMMRVMIPLKGEFMKILPEIFGG